MFTWSCDRVAVRAGGAWFCWYCLRWLYWQTVARSCDRVPVCCCWFSGGGVLLDRRRPVLARRRGGSGIGSGRCTVRVRSSGGAAGSAARGVLVYISDLWRCCWLWLRCCGAAVNCGGHPVSEKRFRARGQARGRRGGSPHFCLCFTHTHGHLTCTQRPLASISPCEAFVLFQETRF